jgi:predicted alpha-1,2-mannosidase
MRSVAFGIATICVTLLLPVCQAQTPSPASYVDPLIGTAPNPYTKIGYGFDTGNVFPGAVCPRGLVAWSPDTTHKNQIAGGYWYPDDKIEAFSLTHFSGRGVPCLKEIAFMPVLQVSGTSPGADWKPYVSSFSHKNETASAGYYRVSLDNGIETELTATVRTGMARFTFPAQSAPALVIRVNGSVTADHNEISGHADATTTGKGAPYRLYFTAQFGSPFHELAWSGTSIGGTTVAQGANSGVILIFDAAPHQVVEARVGISYTSAANARENLSTENASGSFDSVRESAKALWNRELGRIEIEGGADARKRVFETALYHCFIHPSVLEDVNGEYLGMDGKVHTVAQGRHQYQNIPAWDEHRSHSPLMAVIAPKESSDVAQSLVNYANQDASVRPDGGGLPRWEQVNTNSGGMVGDGDDSIIADSYAFGAKDFDVKGAWAAMDKGASRPGTTSCGRKVRAGLEDYTAVGYVPKEASVTLEYCNDDFALSQFARAVGDQEKYKTYLSRAQNWKNIFDASTGYIRPRMATGEWTTGPILPSEMKGYVEGSAAQYVWMVNFNMKALVGLLGGNQKTVERLDRFFTQTNAGMKSEFAYMGNEPCEETPWVYDFAGAPARAQAVVRRIQKELFTAAPEGLPGNDDAGSLSSWYVFSALGFYPQIPGVGGFVVGSPVFPKATVHLENGKDVQITGVNASEANCYVQQVKINGKRYDSPWIPWPLLENGGAVEFILGDKPAPWGSDPRQAPPSFD